MMPAPSRRLQSAVSRFTCVPYGGPMMRFLSLGIAVAVGWPVMTACAAVPRQTPDQLKNGATHIVVGTVTDIYTSTTKQGDSATIKIVAQIKIEKVEKGTGLNPGGLVYSRYWAAKWLGKAPAPPD